MPSDASFAGILPHDVFHGFHMLWNDDNDHVQHLIMSCTSLQKVSGREMECYEGLINLCSSNHHRV